MPRIKRWFPVSHDINQDPEVWGLTEKFGDRALRVWLEILSIADRNDGVIGTSADSITTAVAFKCRCKTTRVRLMFDYITTQGWVEFDGGFRVRNFAKYHKTREHFRVPSEPSEPTRPIKEDNKKPQAALTVSPPDNIDAPVWAEFIAHRKRKRAPVTDSIAGRLFKKLGRLEHLGHDPNDVLRQMIDRNWTGLEIDWVHKNGATDGKRNTEPKGFAAIREVLSENKS